MNDKEIKKVVKETYSNIAKKSEQQGCCSTTGCCGTGEVDYSLMKDEYINIEGYVKEADLQLGCGIPTAYAGIKTGDTVLDLGSGAGNDVFVARAAVGNEGKVIGIDMTEEMLNKANANKAKLGFSNVDFKLGEIEDIPQDPDSVDVVISNCVLNLVPDKKRAFAEILRVLKPGAHFCISDIVFEGSLPTNIIKSAELYAGCVAGALQREEYLEIIEQTGFESVEIKTSKRIDLPDETLRMVLSEDDIRAYRDSGAGIYSITVVGYKK